MNQIYFDNGSTSWPKAPGVPEAMADLLAHGAFNNRGNYEGAYEIEGVAGYKRTADASFSCEEF